MRRVLIGGVIAAFLFSLVGPVAGASATPTSGLRLERTLHSLTGTHRWYVQTYGGYPVLDSYYAVHTDLAGNVVGKADGREAVGGALPAGALVTASAARSHATVADATAELVVDPGSRARLVWSVIDLAGYRTLVDATSGAVVARVRIAQLVDGQGQVFDPNPVVTLKDESLTDRDEANYARLKRAYFIRTLTNLDGSGYLRGDYADVTGGHGPAFSADLVFKYGRANAWFEQVMAYFHVTTAQTYIHNLGFTDANNEPQNVSTNTYSGDNSFYIPHRDLIVFGKGGVDDAEDAEVIWHEYGHAIQDAQVPGFGDGEQAGSIGEGFGDYWAVTMSEPVSSAFHLPCVADWDSTSYTTRVPHCLRRVDKNLTVADMDGEVHHDGEIWSRALWDMHLALGRAETDTIILEAQFSYAPDTSFAAAARATVRAAKELYGAGAAAVARKAFEDRGIL